MACLIKDVVTGQFVGYDTFTADQRLRINEGGDYECIPFYDKETCKRVLGTDKEV